MTSLIRLQENLRKRRKEKQWTQKDLSERSSISQNTILNIEQTDCDPRITTVAKLATALNVSLDELVF